MGYLKTLQIIGAVFFVGRLVLTGLSGYYAWCNNILLHDATGWEYGDIQMYYALSIAVTITFALGAITDLILIMGAKYKSKGAIYFWSITNILLGGIICWAIIPFLAIKAIKEIKQDEGDFGTIEAQKSRNQRPPRRQMH